MKDANLRTAWVLLLTLAWAIGCDRPSGPQPAQNDSFDPPPSAEPIPAAKGDENPDVKLTILDYEGIQSLIASHRGKVVVMDAWSTSCLPCRREFHNLVALHKKHGPDRVACVSLSFDYEGIGKPEEKIEAVLTFLRKQGATFDNILSSEDSESLYRKFKLAAVPAVFVYDQSGKLRKRFDNEKAKSKAEAFTYAQVVELVEQLLREPAQAAVPPSLTK